MGKRGFFRAPRVHWGQVITRTFRATYQHDCTDAAAAMAFDFVFAVFPGILILTAVLGLMSINPTAFNGTLESLGIVIPGPLLIIVEENIQHLWESSHSLFFIGILGVIWPASASMSTTMSALNRAYGVGELRPFWHRRVLSIVLVIGFGVSLVFFFNLVVFSEQVEGWLAANWDFYRHFPSLAGALRRGGGIVGTIGIVACIYRLVPVVRQGWVDVLPGSLLFFLMWSFITVGFRYYVQNFGYYNVVYGVLGAVIVTLLSSYLVAFILLFGGELNAVLYKMRREGGALDGQSEGTAQKPLPHLEREAVR